MADPVIIIQPVQNTVAISANVIPPLASTGSLGVIQLAGDLGGSAAAPLVEKIQGTTIQTPPGVSNKFLAGDGSWQTAAAGSGVQIGGDIGGTNSVPLIVSTHLSSPLPISQGGTGQGTQQNALTALAGTQASGQYLRSDGTNTALSAIQVADVPVLNQNTTGTSANVTGTVAINHGGTGQTSQQAAITALTGAQVSGRYLRSDGTNATLSAIQAADVPVLNQNTTGTASNVSGTVAIANGGTGATDAPTALANLGAVATTWCDMLGVGVLTALPTESAVTYAQTAGDLVLCLCTPPKTVTVSTLGVWVTAAGVTGSGTNALALYSEAGVLIDQTGDMTSAFSSAGMAEGAMGGSHTLTAGTNYYLAFLTHFSGTTPHFAATGTTQTANFPVINGHRTAIFKSAQASIPASFTPSSYTPNSGYFIMYAR